MPGVLDEIMRGCAILLELGVVELYVLGTEPRFFGTVIAFNR